MRSRWRLAGCLAGVLLASMPAAAIEYEQYEDTLMTERAFYALAAVHELMDAGRYDEATQRLEAMQARLDLIPYEQALVLQTFGYIHLRQGDRGRAIEYFEACIGLGALPPWARQGMLYSLAGLYANEDRWSAALEALEAWLASAPEPDADARVFVASVYVQLDRNAAARPWIEGAVAAREAPPRGWYELLVAVLFDVADYRAAAGAARAMLARWPDERRYWEMLQAAYHELGDDLAVMASLDLAYRRGVQTRAADIVNLARLQLYLELPYRAGTLLAAEIEAGRVERSEENLRLLLTAWEAARDYERAIGVIDELTVSVPDGALLLRKARLHAERHRWEDVVAAADVAIARGGLASTRRGDAFLLKGIAQVEQHEYEAAGRSFRRARELGGRAAERARSWLAYLAERGAAAAAPGS